MSNLITCQFNEKFDLRQHLVAPATVVLPDGLFPKTGLQLGTLTPTIHMDDLVAAGAPKPPPAVHRSHLSFHEWGMLLNELLGDCVPAGVLHSIMLFYLNNGELPPIFTDADAEHLYERMGHYVPGQPETDQGCNEQEAMEVWEEGIQTTHGEHKIEGTVAINPKNREQVKRAIWEFEVVHPGIALPITAQGQSEWTVVEPKLQGNAAPGSWGGHDAPVCSYDEWRQRYLTWGGEELGTWGFWDAYVEEAHVVITTEMRNKKGVSPSGVNWTVLNERFDQLKAEAA